MHYILVLCDPELTVPVFRLDDAKCLRCSTKISLNRAAKLQQLLAIVALLVQHSTVLDCAASAHIVIFGSTDTFEKLAPQFLGA